MKVVLAGESTLHRLCQAAGLDGRDARLIRVCANVVFHLPHAGAVARVSSAETQARARRTVRVARWLDSIGFPAVRLHPDVPEAIVAEGQVATFWEYYPQPPQSPEAIRLVPLLRLLHSEAPPFPLPAWDPVADARNSLQAASAVLRGEDRRFLLDWCDRLEQELPSNQYALPYGLIHGDAWVGNLLWRGEEVVLSDLDQVCHGPREWDLVPTAVNTLRFGHPSTEEFLAAYGFDVTAAEAFLVLRQARELVMLTGVLPALASRPSIAREFGRRIANLRGFGDDRWSPYE
ncbi:phosphotransferase enzyme family protein [Sphaerisporangium sp. NPDC049003]|uniref:phosphotransferase enzyme family protein n=1 Tax=Sphaerisporangium sp. NPDC049003 TaxID=3364517 RepID=UPI00371CB74E